MFVSVDNSLVVISDPTDSMRSELKKILSFKDKSKDYQLSKMAKNPYLRNSKAYHQLKSEVNICLLEEQDNQISFPAPLLYLTGLIPDKDTRADTGRPISLPWASQSKAIILRDYQEVAVDAAINNRRGIINLATGCHDASQLILMFDGTTKKAVDIEIGDLLMGPDSKPRKVLKLHRGRDQMFKIVPTKGESFTVNSEHTLSLKNTNKIREGSSKYDSSRRLKIREFDEISVCNYIDSNKSYKHLHKLWSTGVDFEHKELEFDPYFLGLWLGDGSSTFAMYCSADPILMEYVQKYLATKGMGSTFSRDVNGCVSYCFNKGSNLINPLLEFSRKNNIYNNKHIPHDYLTASVEQRLQLLAGLIDTDGSAYEGVMDITQKNKELAENITYLCRSLGFAAYLKPSFKKATNSKTHTGSTYWRVSISGDLSRIPVLLDRKKLPPRKQIKDPMVRGFTVEKTEIDNYYGWQVDGDNLYLMADFTVTHNCGKSKTAFSLLRQLKRKALIVAPNKSIAVQLYEELCNTFGNARIGFYGSGKKKLGDITVGIAQTVINHVADFQKADLGVVIVDEAHRSASNTFVAILSSLSSVGRVYGLTATAYRADGKDLLLNAACGPVLVEYDAKWAIENGHLAQPIFIIRKIKTSAPDYDDKLMAYKSHILSAKEISNQIESDAQKMIAAGKSTLVLVDSIEHGEALSKALGLPFAKGEDKNSEQYIKDLNSGKINGLIGTENKISEGVDTRNVDCLIMGQFTAAKGAVLQAVGRGLRKQGNKTSCFILDYWPTSSRMLGRHAERRIEYYLEITDQVKII
jgi:superfamily II DNA or RNA helicase